MWLRANTQISQLAALGLELHRAAAGFFAAGLAAGALEGFPEVAQEVARREKDHEGDEGYFQEEGHGENALVCGQMGLTFTLL